MTKYLHALMPAWFMLRFAVKDRMINWIGKVPLEQNVKDL
jgi:hypothetical protein